jgi:hypothetical protein
MQELKQSVLLWIQTLDTKWYDKQLVKCSTSCYSQFIPNKRHPLSTRTVMYMGHKAGPHVAKRRKYFVLPGIKPWPFSWHATTVLAKPFCNWLVCTRIKLTLQMLVCIPTIKFDHALWQCAQFKQFRQTCGNRKFMIKVAVSVQMYSTVKLTYARFLFLDPNCSVH